VRGCGFGGSLGAGKNAVDDGISTFKTHNIQSSTRSSDQLKVKTAD